MGFRTLTCPIAKKCGGCEWLAVPYPIQLRRKREAVEELFRDYLEDARHGATVDELRIYGMDDPVAFRHKAATPFAPGKRGFVRSGFYARGTHRIVPCSACLTEDPRCRPILNAVARISSELGIRAYDEDKGTGLLRHGVVRTGWKSNEGLLTLVTNGDSFPHAKELAKAVAQKAKVRLSVVQNVNQRRTNAILGFKNKTLLGSGVMHDRLLDVEFTVGPTSFYQTNPEQTEVLYSLAIAQSRLDAGMRVLDAYCGIGTIGLCAAHQVEGLEVVGVERVEGAVADARRNAKANGLEQQARFVCADATSYMIDAARAGRKFDGVILDPPRAGSTSEFLSALCTLAPERVVYVSCNPQTQRRDVDLLVRQGYELDALAVVDLFPQTKHAETVAVLSRKSASKSFIPVSISPKDMGLSEEKEQPTYANICDYVQKTHGMKVSSLYVAQMKAECGLETQADRSGDKKQPKCPPEKREAILDAFRHFGLMGEDETEK